MDLQRGEAITRDATRLRKMLKVEKKEEEQAMKEEPSTPDKTERDACRDFVRKIPSTHKNIRSFSGPPNPPRGNPFEKL